MRLLIRKDLYLLRYAILVSIIIGLVFSSLGALSLMVYDSQVFYGVGIFFILYLLIKFLGQWELKYRVDIMLNSLPVKRDELVRARYLLIFLYLIFAFGLIYLASNIFSIFVDSAAKVGGMEPIYGLFFMALSLILTGLYLPYEYYNPARAQILSSLFYLLLIMLPSLVTRLEGLIIKNDFYKKIRELGFHGLSLVLAFLSLVIYLLSLQLSKKIYRSREF